MQQDHRLRALARAVYDYLVDDSYQPGFEEAERRGNWQAQNAKDAAAIVAAACISTSCKQMRMESRLKAG